MARSIVTSLKNQGIRLALDDFGTGFSSLAHIRSLPFDIIKIDRSFVMNVNAKRESAAIIRAVTTLAAALSVPVCVEGIENEDAYNAGPSPRRHDRPGLVFRQADDRRAGPRPPRRAPPRRARRRSRPPPTAKLPMRSRTCCPTPGREEPRPHLASSNMVKIALRICHAARPARIRSDPKQFGRGRMYACRRRPSPASIAISDEVKLFAITFLAGFAFVSILIG